MKKEKEYYAMVTIYGLPQLLTRRRYEIAFWLRSLASEVENNHEAYTNKRFTARYLKPIKQTRIKK